MRSRVVRRVSTALVFLVAPVSAAAQAPNDTAEVAEYTQRYYGGEIEVSGVIRSEGATEITAPSIPVAVTVYGRWLLVTR